MWGLAIRDLFPTVHAELKLGRLAHPDARGLACQAQAPSTASGATFSSERPAAITLKHQAPQQRLYFLPEPHGQGSLRPGSVSRCGSSACAQAAPAGEKGRAKRAIATSGRSCTKSRSAVATPERRWAWATQMFVRVS